MSDAPRQLDSDAVAARIGLGRNNEPESLRHVYEPCAKHAKNPPGEQSWNADGTKKRDPNGFTHDCADCQSNATIVKEG